ncbi:glycosylase [Pseudomonas tructae]|uniref:Glycosylase n=1 Tax=Pseudomonas tructae TaxID=2518644 RepID=A0A411MCP7_9PSED|nr:glycosylase [Pseudomonas tructae]QBF24577.1 glycosylase [Pseudomonas tructae]
MFKWKKLGKVFDPKDLTEPTWMHEFAQSPSVLVTPTYVRVYFCSRPAPGADGQYLSYISYIDLDRNDLSKVFRICPQPVMALGKFGTFDEFGTYPVSVIADGDEVRAYYAGWTRCESVPFNAAIGLAISRDGGETFQRLGDGPVLPYSADEPFLLGSPRIRRFNGQWQLWYVAGKEWRMTDGKPEPLYKIRMATSDNGIDWVKVGKDLIADKLGEHECQACPDVIYRNGRYHMFFSYRDIRNYKGREGGYRIGYACSTDMIDWQRDDTLVDIALGETGWDSEMVNYPHVFELDGATYMLYQGNGMGRAGFGLAVLEDENAWGQA